MKLTNLVYDESVDSCLRTIDGRMVGYVKKSSNSPKLKYWCANMNKKFSLVHRLIWEIVNGEIPNGMVINHIDTNGLNNKISNLELCSIADNNRRQGQHIMESPRPDNKLGKTGIKILKVDDYLYAVARIRINNKLTEKLFSFKKYGEILAIALAAEERERMLQDAISSGFRNSVV